MKKAVSIFFLFISFAAFAQDTPYVKPVTPTPMSSNYWFKQQVKIDSVLQARKAIFRDTAAFQGRTFVPNALDGDSNKIAVNTEYMKKWIADNVSPGTPGEPTPAWQYRGNYSSELPTQGVLGFRDSFPVHFITNDQIRLTIPDNGIKRNSGAANKFLVMDTITKNMYYTDGGGGGSTPTLEEVTTAGHQTSIGIQFTSEAVGFPGVGVELSSAYDDMLRINNTSNNPLDLSTEDLTDNRKQKFPDKNGTFAMLSDIGTTLDSTIVATDGQEDFTFSSIPAEYENYLIFVNGSEIEPVTYFTTLSNTVSFTTGLAAGDRVRYRRIK